MANIGTEALLLRDSSVATNAEKVLRPFGTSKPSKKARAVKTPCRSAREYSPASFRPSVLDTAQDFIMSTRNRLL